ncbi:PREDICTED: C-reactive protein-like [Nanorana parkeri]|uniref:C-reactive protein-like n=1 Tax=Nanorana parkeri TaxID=125878 RepID=UPI000854807E|nr:PREDICTED: C-reactive protein-like [Nanorana parkeri]
MEILLSWFIFFSACFGQKDMLSKVIIFPKASNIDRVVLKPIAEIPLYKLTVCVSSYTELQREHALFSLATPEMDNMFLIIQRPPNICAIHVHQELISFQIDAGVLEWNHICVTYDSSTGVVQLWINGKAYPRRVVGTKLPIGQQISVILGQDQDSFGGMFDVNQSYTGELANVNMWDYLLAPDDIKNARNNGYSLFGNMISWRNLTYDLKGEVLVL